MPTVLVTGASSGIGHAAAFRIRADGERTVIGMARRPEAMPQGITPLKVDLANPGEATTALTRLSDDLAMPTEFVHCAGYADFGPLELCKPQEAMQQMQVNLFSAVEIINRLLPAMRQAGHGKIVLVSSIASHFSSPMGGWYHASKAALERYADTLRQEVSAFGIHVVVIQPGLVRTSWHDIATRDLEERTARTPYAQAGRATAHYHASSLNGPTVCDVNDVVEAILRSLNASRPRTRYRVGRGSTLAVTLPRLVSDRTWDALTARQFGIDKNTN